MSLERRPFGLYYPSSRVDNAQKYKKLYTLKCLDKKCTTLNFFLTHIKIHEISPGEIQKSNGLKVTCLMSLYFKETP